MKRSTVITFVIGVAALMLLCVALPLAAQSTTAVPDAFYDPIVTTMIAQVSQTTVYTYDAQLSGETSVVIGGTPYTITTRHTNSGTPIQKATQFVYEFMQEQGLGVNYHNWSACGTSGRNVIGVLTGTVKPQEIVLVTAHLDSMPSGGIAPGADDNASGSVGVMLAAEILSDYQFERTLRFVFFTGEEQGLCGSDVYAADRYTAGDNIVAVYNMDMIAWDDIGGPTLRLHTRSSGAGYAGDLAIAGVFTNVVQSYGLGSALTPIIDADGESASDHASFWDRGYPAILAIEDDVSDFNDYYHTSNDRLAYLNMPYFTAFVKASVGTAAHLAQPISSLATLTGNVTRAGDALPLAGVQVQATASVTQTGLTTTDAAGSYTLPVLAGIYTVTFSDYGYQPYVVGGVELAAEMTATLNVSLTPGSAYVVSGTVRDGLLGRPLAAQISVAGYPSGTVQSDPVTGFYSVTLADHVSYVFSVSSPGYAGVSRPIGPLTTDRLENFDLAADRIACTAPGYTLIGVSQAFDSDATPAGWAVVNNVGSVGWTFNDAGGRGNLTGGANGFAIADSDDAGSGVSMDTELRSPLMDLSTLTAVTLTFKTDFNAYSSEVADVDVSVTGAAGPWTNVWRKSVTDYRGPHTEAIGLSALAGGQSNVMIRFRYYNATYEWWWEVDDVQLGSCVVSATSIGSLSPVAASQTALAGSTVAYTLQMSNTGNLTDTFAVSASGQTWPTVFAPMTATLAPGQVAGLVVSVTIPITASDALTDTTWITLAGASSLAYSQLTTTAHWPYVVYQPVLMFWEHSR